MNLPALLDPRRWDPAVVVRVTAWSSVAVGLLVTAMAVKGGWAPFPDAVVVLAGTVGSLAQLLRARLPLVAAVVGAAGSVFSGNPVPAVMGLTAGFLHGRRWYDITVTALAGCAAWLGWTQVDEGRIVAGDWWTAVSGVALIAVLCRYFSARRALIRSLRSEIEHAELERRLREDNARAAERARIAREMHDVLAHKIALIALHAGALELRPGEPDQVREGAELIRRTSREALQELRDVLGLLREEDADPSYRRPGGVADLVHDAGRAGLAVDLDDAVGDLPDGTARVVVRVVQEALTNAVKHAPGAAVQVTVRGAPADSDTTGTGDVLVTVRNPLPGPDAAPTVAAGTLPGAGAGLVGLSERVALAGGDLTAGPDDDGRTWVLRATVPWLDRPSPATTEEEGDTRVDLRADRR